MNQIAAIDREIGMLCQTHAQKKIAAFSAAHARFALAGQPDSLPLVNTTWNFDLIVFHLVRAGPAQGNGSRRAVESFFQSDHDIGFDVGPTFGCRLTSAESAESRSAATAAEKRFEEVAESSSVKFELDPAVAATVLIKSASRLLRFPSGRRLKSTGLIPIRAKLVVFLSFFRIT